MQKRKMPTKKKITTYWNARITDFGIYQVCQDELFETDCWACGMPGRNQRCHIVDHAKGGPDTESNLVLLCNGCHVESEGLSETAFWAWINSLRKERWLSPYDHVVKKLNNAGFTTEAICGGLSVAGLRGTMQNIMQSIYSASVERLEKRLGVIITDDGVYDPPLKTPEQKRKEKSDAIKRGIALVKANGGHFGKPAVSDAKIEAVRAELARGTGLVKAARLHGVGTYTAQKIKKEMTQ